MYIARAMKSAYNKFRRGRFLRRHQDTVDDIAYHQRLLKRNKDAQADLRRQIEAEPGLAPGYNLFLQDVRQRGEKLEADMLRFRAGYCGPNRVQDCVEDTKYISGLPCSASYVERPGRFGFVRRPCKQATRRQREAGIRCRESASECTIGRPPISRRSSGKKTSRGRVDSTGRRIGMSRSPVASSRRTVGTKRKRSSRGGTASGRSKRRSPKTFVGKAFAASKQAAVASKRAMAASSKAIGATVIAPRVGSKIVTDKAMRGDLMSNYVGPALAKLKPSVLRAPRCTGFQVRSCDEAEVGACAQYRVPPAPGHTHGRYCRYSGSKRKCVQSNRKCSVTRSGGKRSNKTKRRKRASCR